MERRVEAAEKVMFEAMRPSAHRVSGGDEIKSSLGGGAATDAQAAVASCLSVADDGALVATICGDGGDACVAAAAKQHTADGTGVKPVRRLNKRLRKKK